MIQNAYQTSYRGSSFFNLCASYKSDMFEIAIHVEMAQNSIKNLEKQIKSKQVKNKVNLQPAGH